MADLQMLLQELAESHRQLTQLDDKRAQAMRVRDDLLRTAKEQGATWAVLAEVTGMSNATIAKALRRE